MQTKLPEPLAYLIDKFGYDFSEIEKLVSGKKYTALQLKNKDIGICANIDQAICTDLKEYRKLDLNKIPDRIFLNAYFNAKFNNSRQDSGEDLLKIVDFNKYKNIVMIGNFHPIVAKFDKMGIRSTIFDLKEDSPYLTPMPKQSEFLQLADSVILTATTIFNKTFMPIIESTPDNCDIFLLGPSTPMHKDMLKYRNIKHLFGTVFSAGDENLLQVIGNGKGPRFFLRFGKKTMLL